MKSNGFTLIELMIVIAIIGILAAVAIPAFQKTKHGNSDGSTCKYGMKYDRSDRQIIGANGGGIPCDMPSVGAPNGGGFSPSGH